MSTRTKLLDDLISRFPEVPREAVLKEDLLRTGIAFHRSALTESDAVDATDVIVSLRNGIITLSGEVDDRRQKYAAEDAVASIRGVQAVHNELRVRNARAEGRRQIV